MQKILFMRRFKKVPEGYIRSSGTHIKIRDFFMHCLKHPRLDPYLYFTRDSVYNTSDVWADIPRDRIVDEFQIGSYDIFFVIGKDWKFLPKTLYGKKIINRIPSIEQCKKSHHVFQYLKRPAYRICSSQEIYTAITPYITGEAIVINNGIPLELFKSSATKKDESIVIWARKQPDLGAKLYETLKDQGHKITLISENIPREQFAQHLKQSDIFVSLPEETEGFYMPALEGMASGCAVICSDAIGNRCFCIHGRTCLMPKYGDCEDHLKMVDRFLEDADLKEKVRRGGMAMAETFAMENERNNFYRFLDEFICGAK